MYRKFQVPQNHTEAHYLSKYTFYHCNITFLKWIAAGNWWCALIPGGREMVWGQDVHTGGRRRHWSFDLTGDQSGFNLGPGPTRAQLRSRSEGEKWVRHPVSICSPFSFLSRRQNKHKYLASQQHRGSSATSVFMLWTSLTFVLLMSAGKQQKTRVLVFIVFFFICSVCTQQVRKPPVVKEENVSWGHLEASALQILIQH